MKSATNRKSVLLSDEQNNVVLNQLGAKCLSLSTTLTTLSMTVPPDHKHWKERCSGVACFVKDYSKRTFFVRIYDLELQRLVWERNLCNVLGYSKVDALYHIMQLDNGLVGFNFTNENEADHFGEIVKEKLSIRTRKRNDSASPAISSPQICSDLSHFNIMNNDIANTVLPEVIPEQYKINCEKSIEAKDISSSNSFNNVYHTSATSSFNSTQDISFRFCDEQLQDRQSIQDFLDKNVGIDKAITFNAQSEVGCDKVIKSYRRAPPPPTPKAFQKINSQTDDEKLILNKHAEESASNLSLPLANASDQTLTTPVDFKVSPTPPAPYTSKFYRYEELLEGIIDLDVKTVSSDSETLENMPSESKEGEMFGIANLHEITESTSPPIPVICDFSDFNTKDSFRDNTDTKRILGENVQEIAKSAASPIRKAPPIPAPRKRNNNKLQANQNITYDNKNTDILPREQLKFQIEGSMKNDTTIDN